MDSVPLDDITTAIHHWAVPATSSSSRSSRDMISRLPVELLQRIFVLYLQAPNTDNIKSDSSSDNNNNAIATSASSSTSPFTTTTTSAARDHSHKEYYHHTDLDDECPDPDDGFEEIIQEPQYFPHIGRKRHASSLSSSYWSTPIHLSVVCRQWRLIVLSTPQLWSWIDVRGPMGLRDVYIFDVWLRRSGEEMLSLGVHEEYEEDRMGRGGRRGRGSFEGGSAPPGSGGYYGFGAWGFGGGGGAGSGGGGSSGSEASDGEHEGVGQGRAEEEGRSGGFDLNPNEIFSNQQKTLVSILLRAISESKRWKRVSFTLQDDIGRIFLSDRFLHGPGTPNLEEFELNVRETGTPMPVQVVHALGEVLCKTSRSPTLRASWGSYVDHAFTRYVPFHRLVGLALEFVSDETALEILPPCQELRELSVKRYGAPTMLGDDTVVHVPDPAQAGAADDTTPLIVLAKLQVARLNFMDEFSEMPTFFRRFVTPELEELHLDFGWGCRTMSDEKGWKGLMVFLERGGCTLSRMSFCSGFRLRAADEATMKRFLRLRPFVGLRESPWRREWGSRRPERRGYH